MKRFMVALGLLGLIGCAGAPPPPSQTVRVTEMAQLRSQLEGVAPERAFQSLLPLAIEFREGDRIPTRLFIGGDLIATEEGAPPATLVVLRDFTMIMYADRPPEFVFADGRRLGIDDFHGAIQVGAAASKDQKKPPLTLGFTVVSQSD